MIKFVCSMKEKIIKMFAAKSIMINEEENESPFVQVIEELYRCIEKLLDSGKREKDDLQLQVKIYRFRFCFKTS